MLDTQAGLKALTGCSFTGQSIIATVLNKDSQMTPLLNLIFAPQPDAPPPLPLKCQRVSAIVLVLVLVTHCSICMTHASKVPSYICFLFTNSQCLCMYVVIVVLDMVCFFICPMHLLTAWWGLSCIMLPFETGMVDLYVLDLPLPMCAIIGLILQNPNTPSQNYTTT